MIDVSNMLMCIKPHKNRNEKKNVEKGKKS